MIPFKTSSRSAPARVASFARSVRGEWLRWLNSTSPTDDSQLPSDWKPEPVDLDIDLSALESLPSIHWVQQVTRGFDDGSERRRNDAPDPWRTRPDIRFQPPDALSDGAALRRSADGKTPFRQ